MKKTLLTIGMVLCCSIVVAQTNSFSLSLNLGKGLQLTGPGSKSVQSSIDYYLEGGYGVIPQGMQLPLTWYAPVYNDGATALNGVTVSLMHNTYYGTATTLLSQSQSNIAVGAHDTMVIDGRGFFSAWRPGWYGDSPSYGTTSTANNTGLPTTSAGQNSIQAMLTASGQTFTYAKQNYRVATNSYYQSVPGYMWARDNGVLASGCGGYHVAVDSGGNVVNNGLTHYQNDGYMVLVRYTTGNIIPISGSYPWVLKGIEMIVDPSLTASVLNGVSIEVLLFKAVYTDDSTMTLVPIFTGRNGVPYSQNGSNIANTMSSGYLILNGDNYNAVSFWLPEQPELEPNTSYYIGYRLRSSGNFALAVNSNSYKNSYGQTVQFSNNSNLQDYISHFTPSAYDVLVEDPAYGRFWASAYSDDIPMIRAIVGPRMEVSRRHIYTNCNNNNGGVVIEFFGDTVNCSQGVNIVEGGSCTFNIYPENGYVLTHLYIDGSLVGDEDSTNFEMIPLDNDRYYYSYTFYNVQNDHSISATASLLCYDISILNSTGHSIQVGWNGTSADGFEIEYGPVGFEHGNGTSVTVGSNSHQYTIQGLTSNTAYDIYVRGVGLGWCSVVSANTLASVTVESNDNNMGTVSGGGGYAIGGAAILTATANYGYRFSHWSNGATNNPMTIVVAGDTVFTAYFERDTFTLTATVNDASLGTVSMPNGNVALFNDTLIVVAHPVDHYHVASWWGIDSVSVTKDSAWVKMTGNYNVTCNIAIDIHNVVANSSDVSRGTVTGGGMYEYNSPCILQATAYTGFVFAGWSNGQTANPYAFPVTSDIELTALFVSEGEQTFIVMVNSSDPTMGSATVNGNATATVLSGDTVTLMATANTGYRFLRWNDNNTDNPRTVTVTEDISFTAYFESDGTEGISDVTVNNIKVYAENGRIHVVIDGNTVDEFNVYDIMGRNIARVPISDESPVLPNGVYLVKVGILPSQKVVVVK